MSIQTNVADRRAAESLHRTIGELVLAEIPRLPSDEARRIFWELLRESVNKNLPAPSVAKPEKKKRSRKPDISPPPTDPTLDEALNLVEEIEGMADSICPNGQAFAEDVAAKARDIGESVENAGGATERQLEALENMAEGLRRWFHD